MYSQTIVLADNDPQVRQTIVLAIQAVLTDALVLMVDDGETVIDLSSHLNRSLHRYDPHHRRR